MSEPGNLYASLLLIEPAEPEDLSSLPLAVSLAVHGALRRLLPPGADPVEIKWPNDVLIGRKKSCGILLEAEMLADGRRAVVCGIGVNVCHKPDKAPYGVTTIHEQGCMVTVEEVFTYLYQEMAEVLNLWNHGRGVVEITRLWRDVACGIGSMIRVNLPDRSLDGRFVGIDDSGLLILETEERQHHIAAGDVFLLGTE